MMFSRLWLKNFFFTKSLMGTPLDWSFFTHFFCFQFGFRAHLAVQINFFFRYDQRSSYMILRKRGNFGESKLLWEYNGLFWMESLFVRQKKVAWIDLALNSVSENQSKLAQRFFIMFRSIWQRDFFYVKSLVGIPLDWDFFRRQIF